MVVVEFRAGKFSAERIDWDQVSILVEPVLPEPARRPVTVAEAAREVLDPAEPSIGLIKRWVNESAHTNWPNRGLTSGRQGPTLRSYLRFPNQPVVLGPALRARR